MQETPKADSGWWQTIPLSTTPLSTAGKEPPLPYSGMTRSSRYLTMRDGVKIAIDVFLPKNLGPQDRLPTILRQTRYYRRMRLNWPFSWLAKRGKPWPFPLIEKGYAFVSVDARGSGASFGSRQMEWSPDEVKDGAEVVDWIIQQPWSSGRVGTMGVSYEGTTAEMLLVNCHPAVKAAILRYSLFDIYTDILRPGGVFNQTFIQNWSDLNNALDHDYFPAFMGKLRGLMARLSLKSVAPVDEDKNGAMLKEAIRAHKPNYNIYENAVQIEFREDESSSGVKADAFSPHAFMDKITASGTAIYNVSGWYDGAYTLSAVKRFLNVKTPGSRLILGPWDHGNTQNPDPFVEDHKTRFDHLGEILRFFDHYLKESVTGIENEPPVHYFTMGEEAWKSADTFPPPGFAATPYYFAADHVLSPSKSIVGEAADTYQMDFSAGSGINTRWISQVNLKEAPIQYLDRKQQDARLLTYTTAPLEQDVEVTGIPLATFYIRSSAPDVQFFVYLEDVDAEGNIYYVTEGVFHALHRKISAEAPLYQDFTPHHSFKRQDAMPLIPGEVAEIIFHLQPISYLFRKGRCIRLAIAGADKDNFAVIPSSPPAIELLRQADCPSHLTLPIRLR